MADGEVSKGRWSDDSKIVDHQLDCEAYGGWITIDDARRIAFEGSPRQRFEEGLLSQDGVLPWKGKLTCSSGALFFHGALPR